VVLSDFSLLWSRPFNFSIALSKGAKTTRQILHSGAHDFFQLLSTLVPLNSIIYTRKVFSSNLGHLALLFFFISGIHFDGAYFSNHHIWNKDAKDYLASAHLLWSLIGQDILNSDIGNTFQGINITSGIFQLWRASGIVTLLSFKYASSGSYNSFLNCRLFSYALLTYVHHMDISDNPTRSSFLCVLWVEFSNLVWALHSHGGPVY
jgi:hypothetical protein